MARPPKGEKQVQNVKRVVMVMQAGTGKKRFIADISA